MLENKEGELPVGELIARKYVSQVDKIYDNNMRDKYFRTDHIDEFIEIYEKHYDNYINVITDGEPSELVFISDMYDSGEFNDITFRFSIDIYLALQINANEKIGYGTYYVLFINILKSYRSSKFIHYLAQNDKESYNKVEEFLNIYTEI